MSYNQTDPEWDGQAETQPWGQASTLPQQGPPQQGPYQQGPYQQGPPQQGPYPQGTYQPGPPQQGPPQQVGPPPGPVFGGNYPENSRAGLCLTLGISAAMSIFLGFLLIFPFIFAPLLGGGAWYLGNVERKAIRFGRRDPAGSGSAVAGLVLGIGSIVVFTLLLVMLIFFLVAFGALIWNSPPSDEFL